jgi:hypothetical protein
VEKHDYKQGLQDYNYEGDLKSNWLNNNVLFISFSAFFADLGYQAVLAIFPIFLVLDLHASIVTFGIATGLSYGVGAFFGYLGGISGDRFGHKKISLLGNLLIPILSFTGFSIYPIEAVILFSAGWWARNFRSPSRRVLLTKSVYTGSYAKAFGFLHALDEGGGFFAGIYALILIWLHVPLKYILILTIIPLLISSLSLSLVSKKHFVGIVDGKKQSGEGDSSYSNTIFKRILIATSLYGFSSFSLGFPILTVAESSKSDTLGILSYIVFFIFTSLTGLFFGRTVFKHVKKLSFGYFLSALGSFGMALVFSLSLNPLIYYLFIAILGISLGVIETLEPTIIGKIIKEGKKGKGMGALTLTRSLGLFAGNIVMGLLYLIGANYSYIYAGIVSIIASLIIVTLKTEI